MEKDFKKALKYCFLLLKYRARSKNEIICRLRRKEYIASIIEKAVFYLQKNGYIDDKKFTKLFISYSLDKGWASKRIQFKLKELGVKEELIEQGLTSAGINIDNEYEYE